MLFKVSPLPFCLHFFPRGALRVFHCLAFLELSTESVYCAPDENDTPIEPTNFSFFFLFFSSLSIYAVSTIFFFFGSSLQYVHKIIITY